jgi:hypothetical protein
MRRRPQLGRVASLVTAAALVAAPAAVLQIECAGHSCDRQAAAVPAAPFCSLPKELRVAIADGFRDGRSPELLAVTAGVGVRGSTGGRSQHAPVWPDSAHKPSVRVPLVFSGAGVERGGRLPSGTTLDAVAPSVAELIHLKRPFPQVRSGEPVEEIFAGGAPRLVVEVVWKGVGSDRLRTHPKAWPFLRRVAETGAWTPAGSPGSLPLDPAAIITTVGTGGLPHQHGITGTRLRNDSGKLVHAWGRGAPVSVIATLGDDLDEKLAQRPWIGLVADAAEDRGLIGGNWYLNADHDEVTIDSRDPVHAVRSMLSKGSFGRDRVPDLLGVTQSGPLRALDAELEGIARAAEHAAGGSMTLVVTATGSGATSAQAVSQRRVVHAVERKVAGRAKVVEAAALGGLFVDQRVVARTGTGEDKLLDALASTTGPGGAKLFADAFPAIAVSLARYC